MCGIFIYKKEEKLDSVTIDFDDLFYSNINEMGEGLQCNFNSEEEEYKIIAEKCKNISENIYDLLKYMNNKRKILK